MSTKTQSDEASRLKGDKILREEGIRAAVQELKSFRSQISARQEALKAEIATHKDARETQKDFASYREMATKRYVKEALVGCEKDLTQRLSKLREELGDKSA